MAQQQTHYASVDANTFKYLGESYLVSWNFTKRLRSGQSIVGAVVVVTDAEGNDVTDSIVDTGSIATTSTTVTVRLVENGGTVGQFYYVLFRAVTAADKLEQVLEVEIR